MDTEEAAIAKWRDEVTRTSQDVRLIEARIRLALRENDWRGLSQWIAVLPEQERKTLRWQYWQGRSEIALGKKKEGTERLKSFAWTTQFLQRSGSQNFAAVGQLSDQYSNAGYEAD